MGVIVWVVLENIHQIITKLEDLSTDTLLLLVLNTMYCDKHVVNR